MEPIPNFAQYLQQALSPGKCSYIVKISLDASQSGSAL